MATKAKTTKTHTLIASASTTNVIIGAAAITMVSLVVLVVVGKMLIGHMALNARVIGKKSAANKQINSNYESLKKLQSDYANLGSLQGTITNALPTRPNLPALWAMMENIGTVSGVSTQSVASNATSDDIAPAATTPTPLAFTATVQGTYATLQTYLKNIELSARPLRVTSLDLTGTNNALQANIGLTTYYQGPADISIGSEVVK